MKHEKSLIKRNQNHKLPQTTENNNSIIESILTGLSAIVLGAFDLKKHKKN